MLELELELVQVPVQRYDDFSRRSTCPEELTCFLTIRLGGTLVGHLSAKFDTNC